MPGTAATHRALGAQDRRDPCGTLATQKLDLAPAFAVFAFVIFESQLAVAMMRAERSQRLHQHPGKHGQAAWMIAVVMGCITAAAGDTFVEVLLRLAVPLLVTH